MATVNLCRDGLIATIANGRRPGAVLVSLEDSHTRNSAAFKCHLDDLLAVTHGITFQSGNSDGHLMISANGDAVKIGVGLSGNGNLVCTVPIAEYEQLMLDLKAQPT